MSAVMLPHSPVDAPRPDFDPSYLRTRPSRFSRVWPQDIRGTLLLLLLVILVPILFVQAGIYYKRFEERRAQEFQANLELARAVATAFDTYVQDVLRQELTIGVALTAPQLLPVEQVNRMLAESARQYPSIHSYSWANAQGKIIASSDPQFVGLDVSSRPKVRDVMYGKESAVSDLFQEPIGGEPCFNIVRGIRNGGSDLQGIVVASVYPQRLGEVLGVERAGRGAVSVLDSQGRVVYRYPEVEMSWHDRNWIATNPSIRRALSGEEISDVYGKGRDGRDRIAGRAPIRSIGWVAAASRPIDEALGPVVTDFLQDGALLLVVILIALLGARRVSRHVTIPIRRLQAHAVAIGRGELDDRVRISGPTELAELGEAFNRMAKELQVREAQRDEYIAEQERAEQAQARLTAILEATPDFVATADVSGRIRYLNKAARSLLGIGEDADVTAKRVPDCHPEWARALLLNEGIPTAIRDGIWSSETALLSDEGREIPVSQVIVAHKALDGGVEFLSVVARDITELKRMEDGLRFLADAGAVLASSLDYESTLASMVRLAVPMLADICAVEMLENGVLRLVAVASSDPTKEKLARDLRRRYPPDLGSSYPVQQALRTGQSRIVSEFSYLSQAERAPQDYFLEIVRQLAIKSVMIVPLIVRGRTLGAISFVMAESDRRYATADLTQAEALARRAALAADNAELYRAAQEAILARDEFLSVAAHELKTPVTVLRGFAQVTIRKLDKKGALDESQVRRALDAIDKQSEKLSSLVSQLLDISRIEAGQLALDRKITNIASLVEGVVAAAGALTSRHSISVRSPGELSVLVDPLRFEQAVTNLIDNAIKYSPEGGPIDVEVSLSDADTARLTVTDHGMGIPPEHRAHIFDRFYQAHVERHLGGMGLGLYISRQIVSLHGGRIEAEFPPGGGTRFVVILPVSAVTPAV